jgi:putative ABC transport system substrate-binding protein
MRRRDFIMTVGGVAVTWPLGARAQQGRQRKIGFLCLGTPDPKPFLEALRAGLHDLGYDEGKDFQLEVRSAGGSAGSLASLASNLVASKMDVIVAFQTPAATAAKLATEDVPIVMYVADPVRQGFVKSLSRPGAISLAWTRQVRKPRKRILKSCANCYPPFKGLRYWPMRAIHFASLSSNTLRALLVK